MIDDVVRYAGVSRGTFYKYFDSFDQTVEQLGWQLAIEMAEVAPASSDPRRVTVSDGAERGAWSARTNPTGCADSSAVPLLRSNGLPGRIATARFRSCRAATSALGMSHLIERYKEP